jgi:hypothetical protein
MRGGETSLNEAGRKQSANYSSVYQAQNAVDNAAVLGQVRLAAWLKP